MPRPSALGLLALTLALSAKANVVGGGPNLDYLSSMCRPLLSNETRNSELMRNGTSDIYLSLSQSPFPCEQLDYLQIVCRANGTTPIDFAAEQQCLCGGNYFAASTGCADCFASHGSLEQDRDEFVSYVSSLSTAECAPATPTKPFYLLWPYQTGPFKDHTDDASYASSGDRLHSKTAVSAYYTGGTRPTPGAITGDATARVPSATGRVPFTPTGGAAAQKTAAGGLAAVVVGAVMML